MELLTLKIPLEFVERTLGSLIWSEIRFGLENELLDPAAVSAAGDRDLAKAGDDLELIELATAQDGEPVLPQVRVLADRESLSLNPRTSDKWLFLVLAWLLEHRSELSDPLQTVETVYAEFDYPEEISGFVRYMPSDDPDLGDTKSTESRLIEKWALFLREQQEDIRTGRQPTKEAVS